MPEYLSQINRELAFRKHQPMSPEEEKLASHWEAMGVKFPGAALRIIDLRVEAKRPGSIAARSRKARAAERSISVTHAERALLGKAIGHLLMQGVIAMNHARRLLEKLEEPSKRSLSAEELPDTKDQL